MPRQQVDSERTLSNASSNIEDPLITEENLFGERPHTATSISPEQALINLIKVGSFLAHYYNSLYSGYDGDRNAIVAAGLQAFGVVGKVFCSPRRATLVGINVSRHNMRRVHLLL